MISLQAVTEKASKKLSDWGEKEASVLIDLARTAGACVMRYRTEESAELATQAKDDGSPVTQADKAAQEVILEGLSKLTPGLPVVAEEKENDLALASKGTFWLVDPLDGTRDYVKGRDEFTVNIALIVDNQPCIGVLFAPVMDDLFYADLKGAKRQRAGTETQLHGIRGAVNPSGGMRVITSRREADRLPLKQWLESGQISSWRICSSAYKYGLLAAGGHDLFIRTTADTYEWDTAAGDAILRAVGGRTITLDGEDLAYGKPAFRNGAMIAANRGALTSLFAQELLQRLRVGFS